MILLRHRQYLLILLVLFLFFGLFQSAGAWAGLGWGFSGGSVQYFQFGDNPSQCLRTGNWVDPNYTAISGSQFIPIPPGGTYIVKCIWPGIEVQCGYLEKIGGATSQAIGGPVPWGSGMVSTWSGPAGITYQCVGDGNPVSGSSPSPTLTFRVNGASSATIVSGSSVNLTWTSTNTQSCTGTGFNTGGAKNNNSPGVTAYPITNPTTYTISCLGADSSTIVKNVSVTVNPPPPAGDIDSPTQIDPGNDGPVSGVYNGTVDLAWASNYANTCEVRTGANRTGTLVTSGTSGTFTTGNLIADTTYYLNCNADNGSGRSDLDQILINVAAPPPPTVTIKACHIGDVDCVWGPGTLTSVDGTEVEITWSSDGDSCTAVAGGGFAVGGAISGTDTDVTEPAIGATDIFTARCLNGPTPAVASVNVVTVGAPDISSNVLAVRLNEIFNISWDTNDNATGTCNITGGGLGSAYSPVSTEIGTTTDQTIVGATTYTIDCAGLTDSVTVELIPSIKES